MERPDLLCRGFCFFLTGERGGCSAQAVVTRFARNGRKLPFEPEPLRGWCPRPKGLRNAFGLRSLIRAKLKVVAVEIKKGPDSVLWWSYAGDSLRS